MSSPTVKPRRQSHPDELHVPLSVPAPKQLSAARDKSGAKAACDLCKLLVLSPLCGHCTSISSRVLWLLPTSACSLLVWLPTFCLPQARPVLYQAESYQAIEASGNSRSALLPAVDNCLSCWRGCWKAQEPSPARVLCPAAPLHCWVSRASMATGPSRVMWGVSW